MKKEKLTMHITSFLKLVEIQTKLASIIPYLLGTVFALYKFDTFNGIAAVLFFLGMLVFDMTTTAINNYMDHIKAIKKEGFAYEQHNVMGRDQLNPKHVLQTIIGMFSLAVVLGILLVIQTNKIVLIIGVICFTIGVLYSFGPIAISRTPFGEIFSGITMGGLITFLAIYIHIYDQGIITIDVAKQVLGLSFNLKVLIEIAVLSLPAVAGISNIMLANNICDMEDDIINRRYTLPVYIGKAAALQVFKWVYYGGFLAIVSGVATGILPILSLAALITLKPVRRNINLFFQKQSKAETFILAVKNFVITNGSFLITIGIACMFK